MKPTAQRQRPNPILLVRRLGTITQAVTTAAMAQMRPQSQPTPALPYEQWPVWAKTAAKDRQPADIGVGDTITHLIGDTRSAAFQQWFSEKIGGSCGCTDRKAWLNARFPYV